MTPTRRRVRVSKYIILVNTVGAVVGAEFLYFNFINIKQLLNTSKWRYRQTYEIKHTRSTRCCQTKPNTSQSATLT